MPPKINDGKSRQQRWQEKKKAEGLCVICGKEGDGVYCPEHRKLRQRIDRKRTGCKAWRPGGKGRPPKTALTKSA